MPSSLPGEFARVTAAWSLVPFGQTLSGQAQEIWRGTWVAFLAGKRELGAVRPYELFDLCRPRSITSD